MTITQLREVLSLEIQNSIFAGHTYLVGGAVRDHLLGRDDIVDFDVCVELMDGGLRLGKWLKSRIYYESYHVDRKFGYVRLDSGGYSLDLGATRKDHYQPQSRYPRLSFGTLLDDAMRRDFSINALMMEVLSGDIIDLSGHGLIDLEQGIIRSLREPILVLTEDPLRILRAVRFAARFGFTLAAELYAALQGCAPLVKQISAARQASECALMIADGNYVQAHALLTELEIYPHLRPQVQSLTQTCK